MPRLRVAVLMGGSSSEREISLQSGRTVAAALDPDKYEVISLDLRDHADLLRLAELRPPLLAFIAMHGRGGEDGCLQGALELLGIPYIGSGVLASALAMHKILSKKVFMQEGIPTPRFLAISGDEWDPARADRVVQQTLGLPVVVKPASHGSSVGVSMVRRPHELTPALRSALELDREALVEELVEGREITCAILGNGRPEALPLVEIVPSEEFFNYRCKYQTGAAEEVVPARITPEQTDSAQRIGLAAHQALECRGFSRVDMILPTRGAGACSCQAVDEAEASRMTGESSCPTMPMVLEVNTIPGLTPNSLLPKAARAAGMEFPRLLDRIIELALEPREV